MSGGLFLADVAVWFLPPYLESIDTSLLLLQQIEMYYRFALKSVHPPSTYLNLSLRIYIPGQWETI